MNHCAACISEISVLPRRLPPDCRLWLDFRAPERADSRSLNHVACLECCDFSAPQTSPPTASWRLPTRSRRLLGELLSAPRSPYRLLTAPGGSWRLSWLAPDGQIPAAPGGSGQVKHCAACISGISAQTSPSRMSALTVLPPPREVTQEGRESLRRLYF